MFQMVGWELPSIPHISPPLPFSKCQLHNNVVSIPILRKYRLGGFWGRAVSDYDAREMPSEHTVSSSIGVMRSSSPLLDLRLGSISTPTKPQAVQPQTSDTKNSNFSPTTVQLSFSLSENQEVLNQDQTNSPPTHPQKHEHENAHELKSLFLPSSQEMERESAFTNRIGTRSEDQKHDFYLESECDSVQSEEALPFAINEEDATSTARTPFSSSVPNADNGDGSSSKDGVRNSHIKSSVLQNSSLNPSTSFPADLLMGSCKPLERHDDKTQIQEENCRRDTSSYLSNQQLSFSTNQPCTSQLNMGSASYTFLQHQLEQVEVNSLKFSTLMEQADDKEEILSEEPSLLENAPYEVVPKIQSNSNSTYERINSSDNGRTYRRTSPVLEDISTHSFRVSIRTSPGIKLRDAFDVVSNPELLRHWCESIDALIVTDHKGGSPTSSMLASKEEIRYVERPLEEFDDDMIVPPAEEQRSPCHHSEMEYEGEWIQASTSSIVPPHSHSNILDDCVKKTRDIFGFPHYGTVSMFIERSQKRIGFTVGPFKGGITLSHQLVLKDTESREGVTITDEVKVVINEGDSKEFGSYCTCFEPLQGLMSEWLSPGINGYVDQTQQSLLNLVWLIERGGENAYDGNLILASVEDELRQPLLV